MKWRGCGRRRAHRWCRSPCGERGLKLPAYMPTGGRPSRSPCGERGLKLRAGRGVLPGARRSPCGERGLKSVDADARLPIIRRSPCGERGLKYRGRVDLVALRQSLPVRGAWIEMSPLFVVFCGFPRSLPVRGAWIEIYCSLISELYLHCRSPCGERGLKSHLRW